MSKGYKILDRRGGILATGTVCAPGSGGFFEGVARSAKDGGHDFPNAAVDTHRLLPTSTWRQLMSAGRFLFGNVPILRGAILEQANFSLPLALHYTGKDRDWGELAETFVYEVQKVANVKGPLFTSDVVQRLRLIGRKVDGDIGTLFIDDGSGIPKMQLIRAHRIGDRWGFGAEVKAGPYRGKTSCNGCILDGYGRTIAYQVLGETEDRWISANDLMLLYRPEYADYYRGVSELTVGIRSFADIKRLREYEMRAQQIYASVALLEKNETGYKDDGDDFNAAEASATETGIETETYEDGLIKYYKARSGAGLEAFRSDRPSADAQAWEKAFIRQAFYGIEWDPDFALCLEQPGGAWVRAKLHKVRRAIANNFRVEAYAQEVEAGYIVAKGIESGMLPMPKDGDWTSWTAYLTVPLPTADSGNEEASLREAYKLGIVTKQRLVAERGDWLDEVNEQRKAESVATATDARELNKLFPEMSFKEWMFWLEQREANSKAEPAAGQAQQDKAAGDPNSDPNADPDADPNADPTTEAQRAQR